MAYDRCATTLKEQLEVLKKRGLEIENENIAIKALSQIGYFRFKGYCLPYYEAKDKFIDGITFNSIYQNYRFDERLRLMIFQIIEHVEVELKSVISMEFALNVSPIGHYDKINFHDSKFHESWLVNFERLINQASKRRELYTEHYIKNYEKTFPIWVVTEISDFGSLSKFYANLERQLRNKISKENYSVSSAYMVSWIYVLAVIRNTCAHNGRVYDKIFPIQSKWSHAEEYISKNQAFTAIFICKKICLDKEYFKTFTKNLKYLVSLYEPYIDIEKIGFPENWELLLDSE
ncbi:Abi family protein [Carnobacterium maltaromaticum]|uniref:Abi family protein n=1 Tax=Carnobacterium maltaromaticum TaxID=2751 RepID=UPI0039BE2D30